MRLHPAVHMVAAVIIIAWWALQLVCIAAYRFAPKLYSWTWWVVSGAFAILVVRLII